MKQHQRGIALFTVMVMVLLTTLLVVGTSRTAWFNEMITGTDADHQRAFENAQAILRDAEFDIQGTKPDGSPCKTGAEFEGSCRTHEVGALAAGKPWFPQEGSEDFEELFASLSAKLPSCAQGICVATKVAPEFWQTATGDQGLDRMKQVAAHYGEFTGAASSASDNELLKSNAWYWVEVLPFNAASRARGGKSDSMGPDAANPYVYRITAIAEGRKPSTRAVLQTVFVWKKVDS
ncbi:hypothetical protein QTI66_11010 [Variovorax sp. J22R133]|uniref:pilus assembly PilX family protein n=1 Tax=Variovorax brevis TaxID=3053503 RepID=UPI002578AE08|nr:PilX N-terminal domain-containing pilus assembly protein [Variovorax sp. J22R133]MDM0112679.1 hypothetical protein [Variovorax sp. J22R133]